MFLSAGILIFDPVGVIMLAGAGKDGSSKSHPGCFTPPLIRHRLILYKASHRSLLKPSSVSLLRSLLNNQKFTDTFPLIHLNLKPRQDPVTIILLHV